MSADTRELAATLHYLTSLTDMLTAMYLHSCDQNDFATFPLVAEGYFVNISKANAEVSEFLAAHPNTNWPVSSQDTEIERVCAQAA